jgi:hypothetical protein
VANFSLLESSTKMKKGAFTYTEKSVLHKDAIVFASTVGSVRVFVQISREEHDTIKGVQDLLLKSPNTKPVLDSDLLLDRSGLESWKNVIDGDYLTYCLDLPNHQQSANIVQIIDKLNQRAYR